MANQLIQAVEKQNEALQTICKDFGTELLRSKETNIEVEPTEEKEEELDEDGFEIPPIKKR